MDDVEKKIYKGNCHCGDVRFTIAIAPLEQVKPVRCNCSVCVKKGYLLVYPKIEDVVFTHGSMAAMAAYRTATRSRPHRFCASCGTSLMIELKDGVPPYLSANIAVNIRALEEIEDVLDQLEFHEIDGKHLFGEKYTLPALA